MLEIASLSGTASIFPVKCSCRYCINNDLDYVSYYNEQSSGLWFITVSANQCLDFLLFLGDCSCSSTLRPNVCVFGQGCGSLPAPSLRWGQVLRPHDMAELFWEKCGVCGFLGSLVTHHGSGISVHGSSCSNPKWKAQADGQQRMWEHPGGSWV